jgi:hypothetical protein
VPVVVDAAVVDAAAVVNVGVGIVDAAVGLESDGDE